MLRYCVPLVLFFSATAAVAQPPAIIRQAAAATAWIDNGGLGSGTAFCVSEDGLFVTNLHCLSEPRLQGPVSLLLRAGEADQKQITAKIVVIDSRRDLALLQAEKGEKLQPLAVVQDDAKLELGQTVAAIGFPFANLRNRDQAPSVSFTRGGISSLPKIKGRLTRIQTDATVNPGNSGGPLIDERGTVVGVITAKVGDNVGFAIPAREIRELLTLPGVELAEPVIRWDDRTKPYDFRIRIQARAGARRPDAIELVLHYPPKERTFHIAVPAAGDEVAIPAAAIEQTGPLKLLVQRGHVTYPGAGEETRVEDGVLLKNPPLNLSDLTRLGRPAGGTFHITDRRGNVHVLDPDLVLLGEEKWSKIVPKQDWAFAHFHIDDPAIGVVHFRVTAKLREEILTVQEGLFALRERPLFLTHPCDPPVFTEPLQKFEVVVRFAGEAQVLFAAPKAADGPRATGSLWMTSQSGRLPGESTRVGPYVRVEHRMWQPLWFPPGKPPAVSSPLALPIEPGEWELKLSRNDSVDPAPSPETDETVSRTEEGHLVARIKTPNAKRATYTLRFARQAADK